MAHRKGIAEMPIVKEGVLSRKTGMWGKWTDKYFILRGSNLEEYKSKIPPQKRVKADAVIPLAQVTIRAAEGLTGQPLTIGLFGKKAKNTVFLRAASKPDYNDWVHLMSGLSVEGASIGSWKTNQKNLDAFSKRDAVVCATEKGIIIGCNSIMEKEFGWTKEELVGQNLTIFMAKHIGAVHDGYLARYNQSGQRRLLGKPRILKGAVKKDGTPVTIELSLGEVFEGDQRRFIGTMRIVNDDEANRSEDTSTDDNSQWTDSHMHDSDESDSDEEHEFEQEFTKIENNVDSSIRTLKQNLMGDLKEIKRHTKLVTDELRKSRRDVLDIKRRTVRNDAANLAMRRIIFTDWPAAEIHEPSALHDKAKDAVDNRKARIEHASPSSGNVPLGTHRIGTSIRFNFMSYIKQCITNEIESTKSVALLFRSDNDTTKLMTSLAIAVGLDYLEDTLGYLIRSVLKNKRVWEYSPRGSQTNPAGAGYKKRQRGKKKVGFELNPAIMPSGEKRSRNVKNLTRYCSLFIANIVESLPACPPELREVAHHTQKEVQRVFKPKRSSKKHLLSVGGFVFLRFFCPAIIFPHQFGLVLADDLPHHGSSIEFGSSSSGSISTSAGATCPVMGVSAEGAGYNPHISASSGDKTVTAVQAMGPVGQLGGLSGGSGGGSGGSCPYISTKTVEVAPLVIPPHRGLIFVSKFLQNLANGTTFHAEYEAELNELLKEKTPDVINFLSVLSG